MQHILKEKLLAAFFFLLIFFIALCVAEGILRLKNASMKNYDIEMWKYALKLKEFSANPILGHEHLPSRSAILQSVSIRTNELGLRGESIPSHSSARRILFLGSSVTLGWGVTEEKTLTENLRQQFKQQSQDVEVLNAGIGNYNTTRYVERFLTRFTELKPTDIVVQFILRDAEILKSSKKNNLLRHSQLATTVWIVISRYLSKFQEPTLEAHYTKVYDPKAQGFQEMEQSLRRLADYCQANHIRLFLAMTPDIHDLKNYKFEFIHDKMKTISHQLGYTYIDLLPSLKNLSPEEIWAMPGDPHPNALGHQKMAEAIFPVLAKYS